MNRMLEVALERLKDEGEFAEKLWAARIINGLRGRPDGLEPGSPRPHDWGPDDEIWEAILGDPTLADGFVQMMEADREPGDDEEDMSMDEFLERAEELNRREAENPGQGPAGEPAAMEPAKAAA